MSKHGRLPMEALAVCIPAALIILCTSCRTTPVLPPTDFSEANWTIQRGQAVWQRTGAHPAVAGELLLARNKGSDQVVQLAKPPFNLVTARTAGDLWEISYGNGKRYVRGRGRPPSRFVWFQLEPALHGRNLPEPWTIEEDDEGFWILHNTSTGERLEGHLFQ